ncbi:HAMP domain-containing sensor histidine kinase [Ruminococcus sp.]|uniref:sensor histidine kinase n=1 Tax=Ruminococcus sp. TaxID=41978 RepID=UPI0025FFB002|nr:HAMP domain-containing sensor histidine kinase [Ruminococcus sp.]MBQ6252690.1 HAMP domain-containing histidine kinase [Ruminococcus sp.]MBR0511804.1 HAMP domain-containing histidine kinase [Ruminococcus sp.]
MVVLTVLLALLSAFLSVKIWLLRRSSKEIAEALSDCLKTDTNSVITVSSRDKQVRKLVTELNKELKLLREEHHRFVQGDMELKNAVTNISHDLRTPLTAICGYLDMLKSEDKSPEAERYLEIIGGRAEAMKQLTEELFRYSVILASDSKGKQEQVIVNDVLEESIAGYYSILIEKSISPEIDITDSKVIRILDRSALVRVFSNLINNTVKYSDGDLTVRLSANGTITFSNHASKLTSVQVDKLFDRFYTVEAARNSTGLGLSIARTLIEQMGGTISASLENGVLSIVIRL